MKTYKVLEAHQGDRAYAVGDTRIADPNVVGHLVGLGLLEEGDDVADEPAARDPLADATVQIDALTGERDDARAELGALRAELAAAHAEISLAREAQNAAEQRAAEMSGKVDTLTEELAAARKPAPNNKRAAS